MKISMKFERFFAYTAKKQKFFYSSFCEGVNIIHGLNTSGKSTLLQSILFTFGINEYKAQLQDILNEGLIFRLDCTLVDIDR